MQLVLDTNGLAVKKRNNSFWIIGKQGRRMISPHRVDSIAVTADCLMSSAAIRLAARLQIPIFFFNAAARVEARLWSASFGSIATIRRRQVLFALQPEATTWVADLFRVKATHQQACLAWLSREDPADAKRLGKARKEIDRLLLAFQEVEDQLLPTCRSTLMGIEGNIARSYWRNISACLPVPLQFSVRSRRPARDRFNAALNYLYGMLYSVVGSAVLAAGLDPHLGFLHTDEYNKPAFTFDLIEPFRPWVDQLLIAECLENRLRDTYFREKEGGIFISKAGKRWIIPLFNTCMAERIRFQGKRLSRKNHIYRFAGEFAQFLLEQDL